MFIRTRISCLYFERFSLVILTLYPSPNFFLMKSLVPTASNEPRDIIPIRSASISASSKWWVVRIIVLLSYLIFSRIDHITLLEYASIPEVGSSKITIFESPTSAIAKDNFLFSPPDKTFANFLRSEINSVLYYKIQTL